MSFNSISLSIVTPSLNACGTLQRAIDSVANQHDTHLEHIIIDAESKDGTLDVIQRNASRLSYWVSEKDSGSSEGINKGIARAKGDFVGILLADDYYVDGAIRHVIDFVSRHPTVDFVYGNIYYVGPYRPTFVARATPNLVKSDFGRTSGLLYLPACFIRRSCFEKFGAFDTDYKIANDYEFFLRLASGSVQFGHLDTPLAVMHWGGMSTRPSKIAGQEFRRAFYQYAPGLKAKIVFESTWYRNIVLNALKQNRITQPLVQKYRVVRNRLAQL